MSHFLLALLCLLFVTAPGATAAPDGEVIQLARQVKKAKRPKRTNKSARPAKRAKRPPRGATKQKKGTKVTRGTLSSTPRETVVAGAPIVAPLAAPVSTTADAELEAAVAQRRIGALSEQQAAVEAHQARQATLLGAMRQRVAAGANMNARNSQGRTMLHQAVAGNYPEVATFLVENGVDPAAKDRQGRTAWDLANGMGNQELSDLLGRQGARPNLGNGR